MPETCRAKNISIKSPFCIKLAFHIISRLRGFCDWNVPLSISYAIRTVRNQFTSLNQQNAVFFLRYLSVADDELCGLADVGAQIMLRVQCKYLSKSVVLDVD